MVAAYGVIAFRRRNFPAPGGGQAEIERFRFSTIATSGWLHGLISSGIGEHSATRYNHSADHRFWPGTRTIRL